MFRFSIRGLKILAVLCVAALLFVYPLQKSALAENSKNSSKNSQLNKSSHATAAKEYAPWHVLISLVNLVQHPKLVRDFYVCLSTICKHGSVTITLHIVTGNRSQERADRVVQELKKDLCKDKVYFEYHDIGFVAHQLEPLMGVFKDIFTSSSVSYFTGPLFFLSVISQTLFPDISKLIILDADLKFRTDILELWKKFDDFSSGNLIGIAHELQPVYKQITYQYRNNYPHTKIGAPPPNGNPGFNSGVLLMDLARMRSSVLYKEYLSNPAALKHLSEKYYFRGHLGDQDFYTLLSFEHPELFYVLPCTWNRQLCTWWSDKGYQEIFHLYHNCEGYVNIYHGNCGTAIPDD